MKNLIIALSLLLFLTGCAQSEEAFQTISLSEIENYVEQGYIVLDVREPSEFDAGHIPNAQNKPLSSLTTTDFTELDQEQPYLVICQSGNRSQQASALLFSNDYKVVNVSEGMSTWTGELSFN
ncbi:rhodanese-like domain-containing protein [Solibacillus sp. FSL H8-0538]|uniref:rhodanese-like domain-containing protein n=1 Tax=Solibacillus sp. FSL H8-0538 TaxID=2921400 RepID=UPI0030F9FB63